MKNYPFYLLVVFSLLFLVMGISPCSRSVWVAEVIPVMLVVIILVAAFRKFCFSNWSYTLMFFWLVCHTVGGITPLRKCLSSGSGSWWAPTGTRLTG